MNNSEPAGINLSDEITDEQIETLRAEAAQAGDDEQVAICDQALAGNQGALRECFRVVSEAKSWLGAPQGDEQILSARREKAQG